jgi:uncharacterized protein YaiL (DUF2058 family)
MKTKSKSAKAREALASGMSVKDVATKFKLSTATVYGIRWAVKKASKKRIVISRTEADLAKKLAIPIETYAKEKLKLQQQTEAQKIENNLPPEYEAYVDDLMEIRRQIDNLHTIEAFLQIRVDQMKQNAIWQTNK